ncbi:MAG: hypothetical protein K9M75_10100 [Phycisphaerae bacterium]|nr:hypothetical protein [Phycisphaerae bacterium]
MRVWIDGEVKIEDVIFEAGSVRRQIIERSVAALDGVASIDLGSRGRDIKVEGVLRAASGKGLDVLTDMIETKMDDGVCVLLIDDGRKFDDVRVDVFETAERQFGGSFVSCKCKLQCRQLHS